MFFDTDPATQASGDRLAPLTGAAGAEAIQVSLAPTMATPIGLSTDRMSGPAAAIPHPRAVLISDVLHLVDHGEQVCAQIAEQAAGRAGS